MCLSYNVLQSVKECFCYIAFIYTLLISTDQLSFNFPLLCMPIYIYILPLFSFLSLVIAIVET